MAIKNPQVKRKQAKKNEYIAKSESKKQMKGFDGSIQSVLFFALSIMIFLALVTSNVADSGVSYTNQAGVIHNALGRGGALFSSFVIQAFGGASFILPFIFFAFGIVKLRGNSISIYKVFGALLVLVLFSLFSAFTTFQVHEEKFGGMVGKFLYDILANWIGFMGVAIILVCSIPILTQLLFNISLMNGVVRIFQKVYVGIGNVAKYIMGSIHSFLFRRKMERLYTNARGEDNSKEEKNRESVHTQQKGLHTNRRQHLTSLLTRWLGIKIEESKSEEVFDDLMGLSHYDSEDSSIEIYTDEHKDDEELIHLPLTVNQSMYTLSSPHIPSKREIPKNSREREEYEIINTETKEILPEQSNLPDVGLLGSTPKVAISAEEKKRIKEVGEKIIACLKEFKVDADLVGETPGPVITQYKIRPHPGVRVSKIKNLGDDLALKLEAISVRVQAPIPETDLIGIEVPNRKRETVYFQELINSKAFEKQESLLTMALGKTTAGHPFFADLAQMPHLLIAGSTGAGKSVCLNSIILSILYKASPKDVQLLLIDPKRVELQAYQDLPHLVHPVVTQMDLARSALQWAVEEMERRYSSMERMGSKDIVDYNAKVRRIVTSHVERADVLKEFPYMVILIDELADLILTATKEVETNLTRLSQLARACGIHLILATQRPSVDVVTALIKANFPSRIAFRVTSRHDSGTILDTIGAEKLLGKGDMLFKTTQIQRIHGAFVSTDEVEAVVDYWKSKEKPNYSIDFAQWQTEKSLQTTTAGLFADENDPQYQEAVKFVYERGEASISAIQRRFRIGFNKAARYVEQMEQNGILENVGGTKRKVVRPL